MPKAKAIQKGKTKIWTKKTKFKSLGVTFITTKLGCVARVAVDSILSHAECGPNDKRKDAPRLQSVHKHFDLGFPIETSVERN